MNVWVYVGMVSLVVVWMGYQRLTSAQNEPSSVDRQDPKKLWAQGAIALYQGDVGDAGYWNDAKARELLKGGWSTATQAELLELLNSYIAGECNVGFDKLRIIWLARLGRGAGWLDEATSWRYVFDAIAELQKTYGSWDELYKAMKAGRADWYGGADKVPAGTLPRTERIYAFAKKKFLSQAVFR